MTQNKPKPNWTLRGGEVLDIEPFAIMGIVNVAPDSFYDKGRYQNVDDALAHACKLWQDGANIIDLGAESTRPGAIAISAEQELERLMPVLVPLMEKLADGSICLGEGSANSADKSAGKSGTPYVSVDTYHAKTAAAALESGVHIINDISACTFEPELLDVVSHYKPGYVLMHATDLPRVMQERVVHDNIIDNLRLFFEFHLQRLIKAGLPESNIVLDPGIGFGKTLEQNLELLRNLHLFKTFGLPILVGASMKSFLCKVLQLDDDDFDNRGKATQILTGILGTRGFLLHRVHHVADSINTLRLAQNF